MYTVDDVRKFAEQEDVRFIRLTFFDIYGHQKNISILPDQLERAFARESPLTHSRWAGLKTSGTGICT